MKQSIVWIFCIKMNFVVFSQEQFISYSSVLVVYRLCLKSQILLFLLMYWGAIL